jgi:membrane-associated phospholipid phosphatase
MSLAYPEAPGVRSIGSAARAPHRRCLEPRRRVRRPFHGLAAIVSFFLAAAASPARADGEEVYEFRPEIDVPLMTASAALGLGYLLNSQLAPPHCAPRCSREELPAFDRATAGLYDRTGGTVSDVAILLTLAGSGLTAGFDGGFVDLLVAIEAVLVSSAITVPVAMAVRRPRPFVYGERASVDERTAGGAALSFPSGHTANAFAAALAVFHGVHARHPNSILPWVVLGVGLALSTTVAFGRVLGGEHFPSDVVAGAAIGASVGWLVPQLHRRGVHLAAGMDGVALRGAL